MKLRLESMDIKIIKGVENKEEEGKVKESDGNVFVREGKMLYESQTVYDVALRYYAGKGLLRSKYAFIKVPSPVQSICSIFYINPDQYENQILIGKTLVDLRLNSNGTGIELYSYQRDKTFQNKGTLDNINKITLLSRNDSLFE